MSSSEFSPDRFLSRARGFMKNNLHTMALQNFMLYFEKTPEEHRDPSSENEFVSLLSSLEIFFNETNGIDEVIKCFLHSLKWFPNNSELHNKFGCLLFKKGDTTRGSQYILKAYKLAKENNAPRLDIERNILNILWTEIPRWHFRMLNGKLRNLSYKKTIHKALDEGYTKVIDIGSGCGLLSLYVGTHSVRENLSLISFEANNVLHKKNLKLMRKYCPEIEYECHQMYSYSDLYKFKGVPRNLLVTEVFDVAIFGEGVLKTLTHAFEVFMQKDGFKIVPASATIYATGLSCKSFDKSFRLHSKIPDLIDGDFVCVTKICENDPYDAEIFDKNTCELVTETVEVLTVKFDNVQQIKNLYNNSWSSQIELTGIQSSSIDSLIIWFDLNLDENTLISTNPFDGYNEPCWEQAIFHLEHPFQIQKNEMIYFNVKVVDETLSFSPKRKVKCDNCIKISEDVLKFLNDVNFVQFLIKFSEQIEDNSSQIVLDFCTFPLLSLLFAKKGMKSFYFYKSENDLDFIKFLLKKNNIPPLINFVEYGNYPQCLISLEKFDYTFFEPINQDGSLRTSPFENAILSKFLRKNFYESLTVHYVVIHSEYLDYCNRIKEENVSPFKDLVAEMRKYSGTEHPCLPSNFHHVRMCNVQSWKIGNEKSTVESVQMNQFGKINGILVWFEFHGNENSFSTENSWCFDKNVFMFPEKEVEAAEILHLLCRHESGNMRIELCEDMWLKTNLERMSTNPLFDDYFKDNYEEI